MFTPAPAFDCAVYAETTEHYITLIADWSSESGSGQEALQCLLQSPAHALPALTEVDK